MTDFAQARLDMFESGLFGQGNAFWRWIATVEARPSSFTIRFDDSRTQPSRLGGERPLSKCPPVCTHNGSRHFCEFKSKTRSA